MKVLHCYWLGLLLFVSPALNASVTVLKAAHLFDGVSGKLVDDGVIVVEDKTIKSVGSKLEIPAGAQVIDLGDATLLPGFIDAHVHLGSDNDPDWYHRLADDLITPVAELALRSVLNAKKTIEAGFTTVRDVGSGDYIAVGLRNAIAKGIIPGPRMLVSNYAIGATGGHADDRPFPTVVMPPATPVEGICNGPSECRAAVRYQIKYGADVIKFMPSGGVLSLTDDVDSVQLTQEEMNAIVSEAHTLRRKVAAHCHGDAAAKMAIKAGVDSLEHGTFLKDDTLQEMKKKGVFLVPTLFATAWLKDNIDKLPPRVQDKLRKALAQHRNMFARAVKIGVPIAFGTDAAVEPHGLNAHEFALMTEYGMTPEAALMAATSKGAMLLGVDKDTGSLVAGKLADIVAVKGNPIVDIRTTEHPLMVIKAGEIAFKTH